MPGGRSVLVRGGVASGVACRFAVSAVVSAVFLGCGDGNTYVEPPPPEVTVGTPVRRSVTSYLEYTGTTQAYEKVDLRARVKGFLKERKFRGGEVVKAGQLLAVIDEEPFRVRVDQTQAKVAEAEAGLRKSEESTAREVARAQIDLDEAQLQLAKIEEGRNRNLLSRNAGSREEVDRAEANRRRYEAQVESDRAYSKQSNADYEINILSAKALLEAAKADARSAEIDLGFCKIAAPLDGRITRNEVDVGNYVGDGQATVIASIVRSQPIYTYVTVSETDLGRIVPGGRSDLREAGGSIEMGLGLEEGYPHPGKLDYSDPSVDTGTGTVRVRGVFDNADGAITPGLFVRVRIPYETKADALLVPEEALGSDQAGSYVLVVGKGDVVERRPVKLGTAVDGLRVVVGKLGGDDRVVVDGLLRARPGLKVAPKPAPAATAVASAAPPA